MVGKKLLNKKTAKKESAPKAGVGDYGILLSPVITEKAAQGAGAKSKTPKSMVVFRVAPGATKPEIKSAVEKVFGVKVDSVNTVNYMGKEKRTTSKSGRRAAFKKAYVSLKAGEKIEVVEGL